MAGNAEATRPDVFALLLAPASSIGGFGLAGMRLVTGPVRSGKSRFAERLALEMQRPITYVATAASNADDLEWQARLEHHRQRRPRDWQVIETAGKPPRDLAAVLQAASADETMLVDSLGTWPADRMTSAHADLLERPGDLEAALEADAAQLVSALEASPGNVIAIGEEVGWGIVPAFVSARIFRDVLGRLHAAVAARAERVYLVVSGIALDLRAAGGIDVEGNGTWKT